MHPSVAPEPFGRTPVEAMLCRTPLVVSDGGAARQIFDGGAAGLLVPPGDSAALAAGLRAILEDPASARSRVDRGEHRASALYGERRMRADIAAIVADVSDRGWSGS